MQRALTKTNEPYHNWLRNWSKIIFYVISPETKFHCPPFYHHSISLAILRQKMMFFDSKIRTWRRAFKKTTNPKKGRVPNPNSNPNTKPNPNLTKKRTLPKGLRFWYHSIQCDILSQKMMFSDSKIRTWRGAFTKTDETCPNHFQNCSKIRFYVISKQKKLKYARFWYHSICRAILRWKMMFSD